VSVMAWVRAGVAARSRFSRRAAVRLGKAA